MEKLIFVILTFIISITIGWIAIPKIVIVAKLKKLFDKPDERKVHKNEIPRLGGISFFPSMIISVSMMLGFRYYFGLTLPLSTEIMFISEFMFMLCSMFILYFVGLTDDLIGVGYKYKFLAQAMSASLIMFAGVQPSNYYGLVGIFELSPIVSSCIAVIVTIFIVNAYNLIDGVDGLCSGLSSIALICLGSWFIYIDMYIYAMIAFGMLGIVLSFFKYNVAGKRLKIFMGDTGSLTLGLLIVFLSFKMLQLANNPISETAYTLKQPIAIILGIVFIPVFDTLRVFTSRISRKKSPFHPDKTHIHHKMLDMGFSHIHSTMVILVAQICFIILNILLGEVLYLNINIIVVIDLAMAIIINFIVNKKIETHIALSAKKK